MGTLSPGTPCTRSLGFLSHIPTGVKTCVLEMCALTHSSLEPQVQLYKGGVRSFKDSSDALASVLPPAWPCLSLHGFGCCPASFEVSTPSGVYASECGELFLLPL